MIFGYSRNASPPRPNYDRPSERSYATDKFTDHTRRDFGPPPNSGARPRNDLGSSLDRGRTLSPARNRYPDEFDSRSGSLPLREPTRVKSPDPYGPPQSSGDLRSKLQFNRSVEKSDRSQCYKHSQNCFCVKKVCSFINLTFNIQ